MIKDPIARIRSFNRTVTTEVGALDSSFLNRGRPLGVARVLNAIGHGMVDVADIRDYLKLDSGLMSRLLRSLEDEGLITTSAGQPDARRKVARLTVAGEQEFAAYEALSNDQAKTILARHPNQDVLLKAMDLIAVTLGRESIQITPVDPETPEAQYCLGEYFSELKQRFKNGFNVEKSRGNDLDDMRPPKGVFLLASFDGRPVGSVILKRLSDDIGEVKRLWVAPAARGLRLASQLMTHTEETARAWQLTKLRLDTNSDALPEAVKMYQRAGWTQIPRYNDDPHPDVFFEKHL